MLSSMVLIILAAAPASFLIHRYLRSLGGWVLAAVPLGLFLHLFLAAFAVIEGNTVVEVVPWVESLGIDLAFRLDALSLFFALVITGVGALVTLYMGYYLVPDQGGGLFLFYLLVLIGLALGLVLSSNLLTLFVFWELSTLFFYLLTAYQHDAAAVRRSARWVLLLGGASGLLLLGGLLVLGQSMQSLGVPSEHIYRLEAILAVSSNLADTARYAPAVLLIITGCFIRLALFPFHFWLFNAEKSTLPAYAYMPVAMSATAIYLLARLCPALGNAPLWSYTLVVGGALSLLLGAVAAACQHDMRMLLVYSTVSQTGAMTMLLGAGGSPAYTAVLVSLLTHVLATCALFLIAGMIERQTGSYHLYKLGQLAPVLPITASLTMLAALALSGVPPMLGFVASEFRFEAMIDSPLPDIVRYGLVLVMMLAMLFSIIASWRLIYYPFFAPRRGSSRRPMHELPAGMLLAPGMLASLLLALSLPLAGVLTFTQILLVPAASLIAGELVSIEWAIWQRPSFPLTLNIAALVVGGGLAYYERPVVAALPTLPKSLSASSFYESLLNSVHILAAATTRMLQTGRLRTYIATMLMVWLGLIGPSFVYFGLRNVVLPSLEELAIALLDYKTLLVLLIPVGVIVAAIARSRLGALVAVSSIGIIIALLFGLYSAPDLALVQLLVVMLSNVLLLLVFSVLPGRFTIQSSQVMRIRDAGIASGIGMMMAALTFVIASREGFESISSFYIQRTASQTGNVVNAILFNFRGFDVLGGITVLFVSVLGVYGLLRLRRIPPAEHIEQKTGSNGQ